jgi:hypothetical protein
MGRTIVMFENENLVTEEVAAGNEVTENTEQTAEQTPKMFTQEEVDAIVGKRIARREAKIRKEYDRQYGGLMNTLKAGTGQDSVDGINETFTKFYEGKGIHIPKAADYSAEDVEVLARADADEVIRGGYDEVIEELDRLTDIGASNMTAREKAVFKVLEDHRAKTSRSQELAKIGVTEDVYESKAFKDCQSKFNPNTPIADIYDIYQKTQPKKEIKNMGSMKNSTSDDGTVKDFYTRDEALQFTKKDFDKNPALFKAVEASMLKW